MAATSFLIDAMMSENYPNSVRVIDETLTRLNPEYGSSYAREAALRKIQAGPLGTKLKDYLDSELSALTALPKEQRTKLTETE